MLLNFTAKYEYLVLQLGRVLGIRSIAVFCIAMFGIAIFGIDVIGNGIAVFEFLGR